MADQSSASDPKSPTSSSSKPSSPRPTSSRNVPLSSRHGNRTRESIDDRAAPTTPIPDEEQGVDLPLTMAASVVLTGLPKDAHQALTDVEAIDSGKGMRLSLPITMLLALFYILGPRIRHAIVVITWTVDG